MIPFPTPNIPITAFLSPQVTLISLVAAFPTKVEFSHKYITVLAPDSGLQLPF